MKGYFEAKRAGIERERVWKNTTLGLSFEEDLNQVKEVSLKSRAEDFSIDRIPNEVIYLTIGGDTQDDRLEYSILGWGLNQECYVLEHKKIIGNTTQKEVWDELEKVIVKDYYKLDKTPIKISATCFDSGGHATLQVYEFATAQTLKGRKVCAIKGKEGYGPVFEYRAKKSGTHKAHRFYSIGSGTTKEALFDRLKLQRTGEKYIHFAHTLDEDYYAQLTCESPKWIQLRNGSMKKLWVQKKGSRREAPDCWRYAFAALYSDNEVQYKRVCDDYAARMNSTPTPEIKIQRSSYLEKHRY